MPNAPSRLELRALHDVFLAIENTADLARLLDEDLLQLNLLAANPAYESFFVAKKNGEQRLIEDPDPKLKSILRKLNECLQAVYHFYRADGAYGFLISCADDAEHQHRNIVNNARQHLGNPWMLNMDIEDFFHAVKAEQIAWVFLSKPFNFDDELAKLLTLLTTYNGRLPMGAPTSPILSNFASRLLDEDLALLAKSRQWTYSRYADDMTVSGKNEITQEDIQLIRDYYNAHSFEANEQKVKLMGPKDEHSVTGIVIGENKLDLKSEFFEEIDSEIRRLTDINSTKGRLGITLRDWVDDYADKIEGMISFAQYVVGKHDPRVEKAERSLEKAKNGPKDYGVISWLDFPYH